MHIDYELIERERTPLGELTLRRYRAETGEVGYEVAIDGNFLMASHGAHSERAMAEFALERLEGPRDDLRVLVGGLGAGHTLRATLDLPGVARVVVAEIGARVVEWNRLYFAEVNGAAVDDPRVEIRVADLAEVLAESTEPFHLALLDVDNGPGWLAAEGNAGLYEPAGVQQCRQVLAPGGVLAVWSPQANPPFRRVLEAVFPRVEAVDTSEMGRAVDEPGDVVYLAYPGADAPHVERTRREERIMSKPRTPECPVCGEKTQWDDEQQRYECEGLSQHCFLLKGRGLSRSLMLIASDSGEDAELFTLYPWPRED